MHKNDKKRRDLRIKSRLILWRRRADSNRWCSFCRAVPYHLATSPFELEGERETGIESATFSLARRCSTTEPLPHYTCICMIKISYWKGFVNWFLKKITLPRSLDPSIILLHAPGHGMVLAPGGLAGLPRYPAGAAILHRPGGLVAPRPGDRGEEPALPGCLVAHHSLHPTI